MGKRIKSSIRNKEELPFIVLIGASAGGLDALQDLLTNFGPIPDNLAIIIAQHVSPTHKSMLAGLLRRITSMDVVDATTGEHIEANKIYITPPDKDIVIQDGKIV